MTYETLVLVLYAGVGCVPMGILALRVWQLRRARRRAVFRSLDWAHACGHFDEGAYLHGIDEADLVHDMLLHAVDLQREHVTAKDITPHVRAWLQRKGL